MRRAFVLLAVLVLLTIWLAAIGLMGSQAGACGPDDSGLPGGVAAAGGSGGGVTQLPPGPGRLTAATMYGGPGDPSSGITGASGKNLTGTLSFAELGTSSFAPSFDGANNIGELFGLNRPLAYGTRLIATFDNGRQVVVEKQDIGQGGAPGGGTGAGGRTKAIDFWYEVIAKAYGTRTANSGLWSGLVKLQPARGPPGSTDALETTQAVDCPSAGATPSGAAGITNFDGSPCATWIANYLQQARQAGVQFQITPGNCYRSPADQVRACANAGGNPCAAPGQSRHQGLKFPNGAVDVGPGVAALEAYFRANNIPLYSSGINLGVDPPHFSTLDKQGLPGY